ncbi:MAG: hypothetical protein ACE5OY_02280 [Candidatus Bathyarchaeia archaeon]
MWARKDIKFSLRGRHYNCEVVERPMPRRFECAHGYSDTARRRVYISDNLPCPKCGRLYEDVLRHELAHIALPSRLLGPLGRLLLDDDGNPRIPYDDPFRLSLCAIGVVFAFLIFSFPHIPRLHPTVLFWYLFISNIAAVIAMIVLIVNRTKIEIKVRRAAEEIRIIRSKLLPPLNRN